MLLADRITWFMQRLRVPNGLRAIGYDRDTKNPPGGQIERDKAGNPTGLLLAKPNAAILYQTLAKGPKLPLDYQVNSTRHFRLARFFPSSRASTSPARSGCGPR